MLLLLSACCKPGLCGTSSCSRSRECAKQSRSLYLMQLTQPRHGSPSRREPRQGRQEKSRRKRGIQICPRLTRILKISPPEGCCQVSPPDHAHLQLALPGHDGHSPGLTSH